MKSHARTIWATSAIVLAAALATGLLTSIETGRTAKATVFPTVTSDQLKFALYRAGLDPKSLTAAVVSAESVAGVVNGFRTELEANPGALDAADANIGQYRPEVASLEHLVQSGQGTQDDVAALATARTNLNNALAARQSVLDDLFGAGAASLNQTQKTVLAKLRANHDWEAPMEFQAIDRTQTQWVQLREALANERISAARNEVADPDQQALLAQLRADPTVAGAISSLALNLASVTNAWNLACAQQE